MKNRKNRHYWIVTVFVILLSLSFVGICAAYVSKSYVKGVATTPKQGFILSSDYLSPVSKSTDQLSYPDKKILLTEKKESDETPYTFTFSITNSAEGTTKRIKYYLKMTGLPDGATVQYGGTDITDSVKSNDGYKAPVMPAYSRVTHTYSVSIPKETLGSAADITVTATPDADSDNSGYILAGKLQPSIVGTIASFSYHGEIVETGSVSDYAAFNYQISVSNAGDSKDMVLTWNEDVIEIDPLFLNRIEIQNGKPGEITITMSDTNSNYLIQFYLLPGGTIADWNSLGLDFRPVSQ